MQVFSNKPLDLTAAGAVWFKTCVASNTTVSVFNEQPRTALNLGSADSPSAAQEFSAQVGLMAVGMQRIILSENDPLDTRKVGLFLAKNEGFVVVAGAALFSTRQYEFEGGNFGQMAVVEDGSMIELNCSQETTEEPPQFWKFDSALGGWFEVLPHNTGLPITYL